MGDDGVAKVVGDFDPILTPHPYEDPFRTLRLCVFARHSPHNALVLAKTQSSQRLLRESLPRSAQSHRSKPGWPNKNVLTNAPTRCICHTLRQISYCGCCEAEDWLPEALRKIAAPSAPGGKCVT